MMIITEQMKSIAENHPVGIVGTVNSDGTPNVSPKGTMVVLDDDTIIFGEIASPGTLANILERPAMEINFVDVLARRCFRAKGEAEALPSGSDSFNALRPHFDRWGVLAERIRHIIQLRVLKASVVVTPAYAIGQSEAELKAHWKAHFANLD
ncbi:MAG: pyridoxamine 5'-phosphate oxidase family protein [Hyphomicrobiales bacterium]|nr:pyridoxamine 5'-phosphate oxidase family protein [Hyphomicrobiales bacterium]